MTVFSETKYLLELDHSILQNWFTKIVCMCSFSKLLERYQIAVLIYEIPYGNFTSQTTCAVTYLAQFLLVRYIIVVTYFLQGKFDEKNVEVFLVASISEATLVTTISTTDSWNLVPIQQCLKSSLEENQSLFNSA